MQPSAFSYSDIAAWFHAYSEKMHDDPYPFYRFLLEEQPICFIAERNFWVISRHDDVNRVLKDAQAFVKDYRNALPLPSGQQPQRGPAEWNPVHELLDNMMLNRDGADHARLRALVSHAFTSRRIAHLEPTIRQIAAELAEQMVDVPNPDLIQTYAFPLPVLVIAALLGVPTEDREQFKLWSNTFAKVLDGTDQSTEFMKQATGVAVEISEYFRRMVADRKRVPREDMISDMIAAREQSEELTEQEIIATCVLLLIAGHETTVNLIGNGVHTLLRHPEQHARLRNQPELLRTAVDEMLRFESPVQMTSRFAAADSVVSGRTIRQGQVVQVMLGAANRDSDKFAEPDRFDIGRTPNPHLAFAAGPHFCLGAPLARLEAELALSVLLERFPHMRLADSKPRWYPLILFRGLTVLSVELGDTDGPR